MKQAVLMLLSLFTVCCYRDAVAEDGKSKEVPDGQAAIHFALLDL